VSRRLLAFVLAAFVVGAVVMVAFESALARVVGVGALLAFFVAGLFLLIDPRALAEDED
jgi:hypothetical protein